MQITNSEVCETSKGSIYKQIKSPLVAEHAFPLTGLFAGRPMLHLYTINILYYINQVSVFYFHVTWLVFRIINSNIQPGQVKIEN